MFNNKAEFNGLDLVAIFKDCNLININEDFHSEGVAIDSRQIKMGNIFVALKGDNTDGHNYIKSAIDSGASTCIIERQYSTDIINMFPDERFIVSDDNIEALCLLAAHHRNRFNYPIIAIGGSNGKTTTKEMTAAVLSKKFKVLKNHGNFNNKIGVPLTLLCLSNDYDIAVLEVGTNTPGEIYDLSQIIKPSHALITNIGKEHLEFLIDLDGVELEETYLFSSVRSSGFAFVNYDDERLRSYGHVLGKFTTYGTHEHAQFRCEYSLNDKLNPKIKVLSDENQIEITMQTIGFTSALNGIAALSVAQTFGVDLSDAKSALEKFVPLSGDTGYGRMALIENDDFIIINDTYNSNPDSAIASLTNFNYLKILGNKISVLGDMRELGDSAEIEHLNLLKFAVEVSDLVFVTGTEMKKTAIKIQSENIKYFDDKNHLIDELKSVIGRGDVLLIKGSRGMQMELIVNELSRHSL